MELEDCHHSPHCLTALCRGGGCNDGVDPGCGHGDDGPLFGPQQAGTPAGLRWALNLPIPERDAPKLAAKRTRRFDCEVSVPFLLQSLEKYSEDVATHDLFQERSPQLFQHPVARLPWFFANQLDDAHC